VTGGELAGRCSRLEKQPIYFLQFPTVNSRESFARSASSILATASSCTTRRSLRIASARAGHHGVASGCRFSALPFGAAR
jgi:hypothetical protein